MDKVTIIGVDLAKRSLQVHGSSADGSVLFRKKRSRARVVPFFCATANLHRCYGGLRNRA